MHRRSELEARPIRFTCISKIHIAGNVKGHHLVFNFRIEEHRLEVDQSCKLLSLAQHIPLDTKLKVSRLLRLEVRVEQHSRV